MLNVFSSCLVSLLLISTGFAQNAAPAQLPPAPAALYTAKKIFISNAGADSGLFPHPFTGDPDRGYIQFYSGIQSLKRFTLVDDPSQADLVLQLQLMAPSGPQNADKTKGATDPLPMFRLIIFDRSSHYILWTLSETVEQAVKQATHDRNFDEALNGLLTDFDRLTSK